MARNILASAIAGLLVAPAVCAVPGVGSDAPLSGMVAVRLTDQNYKSIPALMRARVDQFARGGTVENFPLANATDDQAHGVAGTAHNVVIKWLDPLTEDENIDAPYYGANNDYVAYFGDGWDSDWQNGIVGSAPQFNGSGSAGWIWTNHEYIAGHGPGTSSAPKGQHLTHARWLKSAGVLSNDVESRAWSEADVDTYIAWWKKQIGGTWMRVYQQDSGEWTVDRSAPNKRYDATDATLSAITGYQTLTADHDDSGNPLPTGVVVGIAGDCSGAQTPFGTVITAEENVQDYYGDLEDTWSSNQLFEPGNGFDPGAEVSPDVTPGEGADFGATSDPDQRHNRDNYGFPVEIDPGKPADLYYISAKHRLGDGNGHRKIGAMGRARWENAAFHVGRDWGLIDGKPVVMFAANDRRSGRIYKLVSSAPYKEGMKRDEVRSLLDSGKLYVAHFAGLDTRTGFTLYDADDTDCNPDPQGREAEIAGKCTLATEENPGHGEWIWMSVDNNAQIAPNAAALGEPAKTVGQALRDVSWNGIGGFLTDNDVWSALFTAGMKLGVMELNRPEDVEWNANYFRGPVLHVAFTKSGRQVALQQNGVKYDPAVQEDRAPRRIDGVGSIFSLREQYPDSPGASLRFEYWMNWLGTRGTGPHDAANPDNLAIDSRGGLWFGTDGNFGTNGTADAVYYLDQDPAHRAGRPGVVTPTFGLPFRLASGPGNSEATGPAFSSDEKTFFFNVQHPGEEDDPVSTWPRER
jgi:secreted PhoX family phosphatase